MSAELRYWDSNAFLAYFQAEEGRVDACEAVLEEAEKGKILIVTSAFTLAEVLAIRGKAKLPPKPQMKQKVVDFFKNEYISVQNVTREIAELSRDLVWDKGIKPKDAIHVASAIAAEVAVFETYDGPLIGNYIHDSLDSGRGVIYIGFIKNGAKPMTTTNLPKLSTRAQKALDVLADGGKFVCRLERNGYTGREQFAYRLLKEGRVVRGIGLAAFYEIKDTFLTICDNNTSVSTYYQLRREA